MKRPERLTGLVEAAIRLGASDAAVIPSSAIVVEEELAGLCGGEPGCDRYGLGAGCPPHVCGPSGFRAWQAGSDFSIVVRIDVPTASMFSDERLEIMRLLHEIVAGVEREARAMGYPGSLAFAGGSCKQLFCGEQAVCLVVEKGGGCRHPDSARPSMSGFGINVGALMASCGWSDVFARREQAADETSMTWVAGLVLISDSLDGEGGG